ncbi:MAG TPA: enoyl-CoA hydratase-related protein [Alphaproteobacteria bacterium]|nr:enoyl-CoA hydratase-related protein [Alphaproteobacteria bacterium]
MSDIIVARRSPEVAVVTIDRPARRNACNLAAWRDLAASFAALGREREVRLVILTGAAGHFSAGADISEFAALRADHDSGAVYEREVAACYDAIQALPQPSVAAIQGYCVGGGMAIAMACDFRVAQKGARLGIPAAKLGTIYSLQESALLLALVGLAHAKRILYGGELVDAAEAVQIGLVDRLSEGEPVEAALDFAAAMVANAPLSIAGAKRTLEALARGEVAERTHEIEALVQQAFESADYKEGAKAFMEKRRAHFVGR